MSNRIISKEINLNNSSSKYITEISNNGIQVHPSGVFQDYIQLNSNNIDIFKNNISKLNLTDSSARLGDLTSGNYTILDSTNGLRIFKNSSQIAKFSDKVLLGEQSSGTIEITNKSISMYSPTNLTFRVLDNGNLYTYRIDPPVYEDPEDDNFGDLIFSWDSSETGIKTHEWMDVDLAIPSVANIKNLHLDFVEYPGGTTFSIDTNGSNPVTDNNFTIQYSCENNDNNYTLSITRNTSNGKSIELYDGSIQYQILFNTSSTVCGTYSESDGTLEYVSTKAFAVGVGQSDSTSDNGRKDAFSISYSGNAIFSDDVAVGGLLDAGYIRESGIDFCYSTGDVIQYGSTYEGLSIGNLQTAGYVSSSSAHVYFTIPLDKPCRYAEVWQDITLTSISGFKLRQNNNYTHGSSASTWVKPSSVNVLPSGLDITTGSFSMIMVDATFSKTTNAINNAPIGIQFSGKIEFGSRA